MTYYVSPGLMDIDDVMAHEFMIDRPDLYSKRRDRAIAEARQLAMYIRVKYQLMSLKQAAQKYNRDHCTAIYAIKTVENLMKTDRSFRIKAERSFAKLQLNDKNEELHERSGNTVLLS